MYSVQDSVNQQLENKSYVTEERKSMNSSPSAPADDGNRHLLVKNNHSLTSLKEPDQKVWKIKQLYIPTTYIQHYNTITSSAPQHIHVCHMRFTSLP